MKIHIQNFHNLKSKKIKKGKKGEKKRIPPKLFF